MPQAGTAHSFM